MSEAGVRAGEYADRFIAANREFIALIEALNEQQWGRVGQNYPVRLNDEDEGRSVGVIAHHVAVTGPFIMARTEALVAGRPISPVDFTPINREHALQHSAATREEVLDILRANEARIAAAVRGIPDEQLDTERETPAGPNSVAQRLEVLIIHIKMHQGSIEAAIG